ncbi:MAG: hypothetical protein R3326_03795 [Gemmatimonadota bacterium]|nr:hypothetical protein [Gemmatimonadota bacterium]
MIIRSGQEAILVSIQAVTLHGDPYFDVVVADPDAADDPSAWIRGRLGPESVEGDPGPGDRVKLEGFLQTITAISTT